VREVVEREAVLALGRDEIDELGFLATQSANALTREPAAASDVGDLADPGRMAAGSLG
jgi:hypothetical protein